MDSETTTCSICHAECDIQGRMQVFSDIGTEARNGRFSGNAICEKCTQIAINVLNSQYQYELAYEVQGDEDLY